MPEYKIIVGDPKELQKILNQWRHQYELDILHIQVNAGGNFGVIVLTRKEK